jgi:predicted secreted Zn-dependent protease
LLPLGWLTTKSLLLLIKDWYSFHNIAELTERQLNKALDKHYPHMESGSIGINGAGIFESRAM